MADADVVVVGAGPNGLTAAILLARAGLRVLALEASDRAGGAVRTEPLTLPGFRHDRGAGFFPLAPVGPIGQLGLADFGLQWCNFVQPYGGGTPSGPGVALGATVRDSLAWFRAAQPGDERGWTQLWEWWRRVRDPLLRLLFTPLGDPGTLLRLALEAARPRRALELVQILLRPARALAEQTFQGEDARVWLVGSTLHSDLAPEDAAGTLMALLLSGLAQEHGMPIPRGGAGALAEALRRCLEHHGGAVRTGEPVTRVLVRGGRAVGVQTPAGDYGARYGIVATADPKLLLLHAVGEGHLPASFVRAVRRYRRGVGTFKLDCALSRLPAWHGEALRRTGVLHLAESVTRMSAAANATSRGLLPAHPLLIAGIPTLADPSRAPAGAHTLWLETHVPAQPVGDEAGQLKPGSWAQLREPFAERLLDELERYAPGLRQLVRGHFAQSPLDLQAVNANLVDGDIMGGSVQIDQQLVFRPVPGWFRYRTPLRGLYLSGAATHPGGGVHGGPGANAARVLLADLRLERGREELLREVRRLVARLGH